MKGIAELVAFNRGLISRLALARIDLKRSTLSAEVQTNWMPRALGSMMLRPGFGYLGATRGNGTAKLLPFVFSSTDTAQIELTDLKLRIRVDGELITRVAVSATITNGDFDTDLTGWTDNDDVGATSSWATGGYMSLIGTDSAAAVRYQQVAVTETGAKHALRIVIERGPVTMRVGSTAGGADYISDTSLAIGTHSITVTPTGDFYVQFSNRRQNAALVNSVQVESAGVMEVDSPWAAADLSLIRHDQSGDVIFVACEGYPQYRIERRNGGSWSVVLYQANDGPFRIINTGTTTITPSGLNGNITLLASASLFRSGHVGGLFSITSTGQRVEEALTDENQFSDAIRVTGINNSRIFTIEVAGTFVATITLQRSVGDIGAWEDVESYTVSTSKSYDDGLDNQIIYYRLGIKTGDYTSGTATAFLTYTIGSLTGVVRITAVTDELNASAEVLRSLGGTTATDSWAEGDWSGLRGYPSSVSLYEGRLWWAGKDKFWGSVTDAFDSFDPDTEGDAGPIQRSIGSGPVDSINWLMPLQRLLAGTDGSELSCRSSSFDEPLTPTNFNVKDVSTQGSAKIAAVKVDGTGVFVQRCGLRLYQLGYDINANDFKPEDLTAVVPEIGYPGIVAIDVQRQPDTRIHCVRSDGTVAVLIFDPTENVNCWVTVETDGIVEDVCVLPGAEEDEVSYVVKRTVNGGDVRYVEKWAMEREARGGAINKIADSFAHYSGVAATVITGLDHLEGESVVVWADGIDVGAKTVSGGQITLTTAASDVVAGLPYEARYKSTKLAFFASSNSPNSGLIQRKHVNTVGMILADTHAQGIQYGPDFDHLDDLPQIEYSEVVDPNKIWESYDADSFTFNGEWNTDSRVCILARAPRPATVLALVIDAESNTK